MAELWGIDTTAGEAVIKEGMQWILVSADRSWRPTPFGPAEEVFRWALSHRLVSLSRRHPTLDAAVIEARKVCLLAWQSGASSSDEVLRLFRVVEQAALLSRTRRKRRPNGAEWEQRFRDICRAAMELDGFFEQRGYSVAESLHLILRTLDRVQRGGRWKDANLNLLLGLFETAYELLEQQREDSTGFGSDAGESDQQLPFGLSDLDTGILDCLSLWADQDAHQIAILLRVSAEQVEQRLKRAGEFLGQAPEQLRRPEIALACLQLLQMRADDGSFGSFPQRT